MAGLRPVGGKPVKRPTVVEKDRDPPRLGPPQIAPFRLQGRELTVALADPLNKGCLDELHFLTGCEVKGAIADEKAIEQLTAMHDLQNTVPMDAQAYRFDIVLRGRRSTLFENRMEGN